MKIVYCFIFCIFINITLASSPPNLPNADYDAIEEPQMTDLHMEQPPVSANELEDNAFDAENINEHSRNGNVAAQNIIAQYALNKFNKDMQNHPNSKQSDDRYPNNRERYLKNVELRPLSGFKFCKQLDDSLFNMNAMLRKKIILKVSNNLKLKLEDKIQRKPFTQRFKSFFKNLGNWFKTFKWGTQDDTIPLYVRDIADLYPKIIDELARSAFARDVTYTLLRSRTTGKILPIGLKSAKRFACYMAADGYNRWVKVSKSSRILQFVDPVRNFGSNFGFLPLDRDLAQWELENSNVQVAIDQPADLTIPPNAGTKVKAKLAYFLLVHKDLKGIKRLIDALYDNDVFIVIHVDGRQKELRKQVAKFLRSRKKKNRQLYFDPSRIQLSKMTFQCAWGHASLVFAQLSGFFQLLNMGTGWEYVINLSGNDYPLLTNSDAYLNLKMNGNANWINYFDSPQAYTRTQTVPFLQSENENMDAGQAFFSNWFLNPTLKDKKPSGKRYMSAANPFKFRFLTFPFYGWKLYKQHQWMILTRSFVAEMQRSPSIAMFLAYSEFTEIPDEHFFANVAVNVVSRDPNTGGISERKVINNMRRFLQFPPFSLHPRWITKDDMQTLKKNVREKGAMFTRKIDLVKEHQLLRMIDAERRNYWDFLDEKSLSTNIKKKGRVRIN